MKEQVTAQGGRQKSEDIGWIVFQSPHHLEVAEVLEGRRHGGHYDVRDDQQPLVRWSCHLRFTVVCINYKESCHTLDQENLAVRMRRKMVSQCMDRYSFGVCKDMDRYSAVCLDTDNLIEFLWMKSSFQGVHTKMVLV